MINTMLSVLSSIVLLFPFIVTLLVLLISKRMGKAPISVLGIAADLTTPLLFLSVYVVARSIFGAGVGFYIMITAVIIVLIYSVFEKKNVKEFRIIRLLRKVWRLFFLVLGSSYLLLLLIGVAMKILEYAK